MDNIPKIKSVLISIQPKWCELIASGKKTVEVRKTKPKLDTPFKCYIYCTKDKWQHFVQMPDKSYRIYDGKDYGRYNKGLKFNGEGNGKVIGEFICDEIIEYNQDDYNCPAYEISDDDLNMSYLHQEELYEYGHGKTLYGWHISDLVIYDEPKELSEFRRQEKPIICNGAKCEICEHWRYIRVNADEFDYDCDCGHLIENFLAITRAPQSWCYVEEVILR